MKRKAASVDALSSAKVERSKISIEMFARAIQACRLEDPDFFSLEFADAVTTESITDNDLIAKNGKESLFDLLKKLYPQVWSINYPSDQRDIYTKEAAIAGCAAISSSKSTWW